MSSVCPSRIRHPFPAQDTRLWLFPAVPASVNSAGERTRVLHAECKSSQPTNPSISIHAWQRRRKPPHAIMAGNLIFKLEIICPGMGDGHHNHLPSKPQTARDGCREGREAVIILFLFSKPHHSLIFPHISGCQCKGAALFFPPCQRRKARQLNPAWNTALMAAPRWVPKPPNRMLLCIISKAQLFHAR